MDILEGGAGIVGRRTPAGPGCLIGADDDLAVPGAPALGGTGFTPRRTGLTPLRVSLMITNWLSITMTRLL